MNKENKLLIIAAAIIVVLIGGVFAVNMMRSKPADNAQQSQEAIGPTEEQAPKKEVKPPASFAEGYEQAEVGMSKADVEILLGKPMNCRVVGMQQLNKKIETCSYKDPASTAPASLADATVDFSEDGKVIQKQKY